MASGVITLGDPPEVVDDAGVVDAAAAPLMPHEKLRAMAGASGNISEIFPPEKLAEIGETVVSTYERDKADRSDWEDTAREALDACSQEENDKAKEWPWANASNMKWPLLTIAAMQFNARMLPAVVKGDEAVLCKVIGQDNGKVAMAPNPQTGEMQPVPMVGPDGQFALDPQGNPQPHWLLKPGAKAKRARRVSEYMNTVLFYRMENWEDDTDALLMQLPPVGCMFRKIWADENGKPQSATISALDVVVPQKTRSLATALRITERMDEVYPHEIRERMRSGFYRDVPEVLGINDPDGDGDMDAETDGDTDGGRLLLEQHCLWDFDEDGLAEPYIVTVDHETHAVLRIEPNFSHADIEWKQEVSGSPMMGMLDGIPKALTIKRRAFYVKYSMFPHPAGKFYDIGFGHFT